MHVGRLVRGDLQEKVEFDLDVEVWIGQSAILVEESR